MSHYCIQNFKQQNLQANTIQKCAISSFFEKKKYLEYVGDRF